MSDLVQNIIARLEVDHAAWDRGLQQASRAMDQAAASAQRANARMTAAERSRASASQATTTQATASTARQTAAHQQVAQAATASAAAQQRASSTVMHAAQQSATATASAAARAVASNRQLNAALGGAAPGAGIGSAMAAGMDQARAQIATAASAISSTMSRTWSGITSGASRAWGTVTTGASRMWSGITTGATRAWSGITGGVSRMVSGTRQGLNNFASGFRDANAAASTFSGRMGTLGGAARSVVQPLANAATNARNFGTALTSMSTNRLSGLNTIAGGFTKLGAGLGIAAGLSMKASIDWEQAWTGVTKTVDGTPKQLDTLEKSLRGLSKTLPNSNTELAAIAQNAGQLGVSTPNIAKFTDVIARLATSTNLTAEDGSMAMAKFMGVMGDSFDQVDRYGATLVGLGNHYATTESDIMEFSQRLAGSGKIAGLSGAEVMGLGTAMSAVGINAEAGGTAMSTIMTKIGKAVDGGYDKLDAFAKGAGVSAGEFAATWQADPAKALDMLVSGLKNAQENGEGMNGILDEMGIKNVREADTMRRLAGSADGVGKAVKQANEEFEKNTALMNESDKFNATAANRMKIAWNKVKDGAIDAGKATVPAVASITDGLGNIMQGFNKLPQSAKTGIGAFTILGAGAALAVGGLGKLIVGINNTKTAWGNLAASGSKASKFLGAVGKAGGIAAGVLLLGSAVKAVVDASAKGPGTVDQFAGAIQGLSKNAGKARTDIDSLAKTTSGTFLPGMNSMGDAINAVNMTKWGKTLDWVAHLGGLIGKTDLEQGSEGVKNYDQALTQLAQSGNLEAASKGFQELYRKMDSQGENGDNVGKMLTGYMGTLKDISATMGVTISDAQAFDWAFSGVAPKAVQAAAATDKADAAVKKYGEDIVNSVQPERFDKLADAIEESGNAFLNARGSAREYKNTLKEAWEQIKKNKGAHGDATQAARDNEAALDSVASSAWKASKAAQTVPERMQAISKGRADVVALATSMGYSATEAADLADSMGLIPSKVYSSFEFEGASASEKIRALVGELDTLPKDETITIKENSPVVKAALKDLGYKIEEVKDKDGNVQLRVTATGTKTTKAQLDKVANDKYEAKVNAKLRKESMTTAINGAKAMLNRNPLFLMTDVKPGEGKKAKGKVEAEAKKDPPKIGFELADGTKAANQVEAWKKSNLKPGKMDIDGDTKKLDFKAAAAEKSVGTKKGVIQIDANTGKAKKKADAEAKKKRSSTIDTKSSGKGGKQADAEAKKKRDSKINTHSDGKGGKQADAEAKKKRKAQIETQARLDAARSQLRSLTGNQGTASIQVQVKGIGAAVAQIASIAAQAASVSIGHANGGRVNALPRHAGGGRLPSTGLGTDQILGVSRKNGTPTAWVDDREWVINRRSSDQFDGTLSAINRGDRQAALASLVRGHADGGRVGELPGLASGGRYRWAGQQVASASRSFDRSTSNLNRQKAQLRAAEKAEAAAQKRLDAAKSKSAKDRARAALKRAKARVKAETKDVTAADKAREKRRDNLQKARERRTRLGELEFSTRRDLYRGNIRDKYGAGNYSGVDALFEQSKNTDLSKYRRKQLSSLAYKQERQVKSLTKQSDKLTASLEKASAKRDELLSSRNSVRDAVIGSFNLTSLTGEKDQWGYSSFTGKKGILSYAAQKASGAKKLSGRLNKLQKLGFPSDLLQQVVDEWTQSGTFQIADALLSMNASERNQVKSSYKTVENYGRYAGQHLTEAMYKGGYNAAAGIVSGLAKQQKKVESAFAKLAKQGERAFKKALGIKSPSRVMAANGAHVVAGLVKGVAAQQPVAVRAMTDLGSAQADAYRVAVNAPAYRLPASSEVQAYAAAQGTGSYVTHDEFLQAIDHLTVEVHSTLKAGNRDLAYMVQQGQKYIKNNA